MEIQSVKQRFGIIGNDPAMGRALEVALRVAGTDLSVLVTGESGVGKEFFPQVIHAYSSRKHNKYIAVNCGAIPEGTIDSELFGHEKGAFTGANDSRKGYFEEADTGTIFLDEVAELPLSTQVRLLRVLQDGEYIRVGSSTIKKTNVRVVAATNVDLQDAIASGRFREDLYYRLNTVPIHVPSLRERKGDINLLFRKFASDIALQYRMPAISLDEGAKDLLENYPWPGNVRQLKNVAEQVSAIEERRAITPDILEKYLPKTVTTPVFVGGAQQSNTGSEHSDRDLLYRILFDMRTDINELKRMIQQVMEVRPGGAPEIAGLLPAQGYTHDSPFYNPPQEGGPPEFAAIEEVKDDKPEKALSKKDMQREAIIESLRRNNGKRKDVARELFMSERTLYRKIKEYGLDEL